MGEVILVFPGWLGVSDIEFWRRLKTANQKGLQNLEIQRSLAMVP